MTKVLTQSLGHYQAAKMQTKNAWESLPCRDDVSEWLRRQTRNLLGLPAQVQILSSSIHLYYYFPPLFFFLSFFSFLLFSSLVFASVYVCVCVCACSMYLCMWFVCCDV